MPTTFGSHPRTLPLTRFLALLAMVITTHVHGQALVTCGDCNPATPGIDVLDSLRAAQHSVGLPILTTFPLPRCDVDGSGSITVTDALRIAQVAAGLTVTLDCNTPPQVQLLGPAPPVFGDLALAISVHDFESDPVDLQVEWSTDHGLTWHSAALPPGTSLASLPAPAGQWTPVNVTWQTERDFPLAPVDDVLLRITAYDTATGQPGDSETSSPFDVSNFDVGAWQPMTPAGSPPRARHGSLVSSISGTRALVFQGRDDVQTLGDARSLDLAGGMATWNNPVLAGAMTPPRSFAAGVHDPANLTTVIFGGVDSRGGLLGDLHLFSHTTGTFTPISVPGGNPPARLGSAAVYDPGQQRMLVLGGLGSMGVLDEGLCLDLSRALPGVWTPLAGSAPPRAFAAAAIDPARGEVFLFGGEEAIGRPDNRVFVLDLATEQWSELPTAGPAPAPRRGASMHYDPASQRLLVAGGEAGGQGFADVFALDLSASPARWRPLGFQGGGAPSPRSHASWFLDGSGDLYVFGGRDPTSGASHGDLWKLDRR